MSSVSVTDSDPNNGLIYGFHPVRELLRHRPHSVERVWVVEGRKSGRRQEIEALCVRHRLVWELVAESWLRELSGGGPHNGFAARVRQVESTSSAGDASFQVLVEDVQDPRNLGALLRVCEGAGVGRVLVRDRGSAPFSSTVAKTSAGASEWLALERVTNSARAIQELQDSGYWVYGTDSEGVPPWEVDLTGPVLLCFGGEQKGLRVRTRKICDRLLGLPMLGKVQSLNLSTAVAAVLYEALRQRSCATPSAIE